MNFGAVTKKNECACLCVKICTSYDTSSMYIRSIVLLVCGQQGGVFFCLNDARGQAHVCLCVFLGISALTDGYGLVGRYTVRACRVNRHCDSVVLFLLSLPYKDRQSPTWYY